MTASADSHDLGSDELGDEAMALLLTWQANPQDGGAREAIQTFCARSPAHLGAWQEAKRVYHFTGEAVRRPAKPIGRRLARRQIVTGIGALAIGAGALRVSGFWGSVQADEMTDTAEIRQIRLADGSLLTLGPDSAVNVEMTGAVRRIQMLDGMALCEVATGLSMPFTAEAGPLSLRASGGTFEVRRDGSWSFGAVSHGEADASFGVSPVRMLPGDWLSLGPTKGQVRRGTRDISQIASWRERLLVADRERVASVVAEIGRWHNGRILVPQPSLADAPVSGLFDLSNPDEALATVVAPYGGKVRWISPWLTVLTTL